MKEIDIETLRKNPPRKSNLLHLSGLILLDAAEELTPKILTIFEESEIISVIIPDEGETLEQVRFRLTFSLMSASELVRGQALPSAIYDQQNRLLLEAGTPITESFCETLQARGIREILVRKHIPVEAFREVEHLRKKIRATLAAPLITPNMGIDESCNVLQKISCELAEFDDFSPQKLQARIDKLTVVEFKISGDPFSAVVKDTRYTRVTEEEKTELSHLVDECLVMSCEIFAWFSKSKDVVTPSNAPIETLNRLSSSIMAGMIQHKDIMRLCAINTHSEEYLPAHSLAVAVVACLVGTRINLGIAQVKALIYGALLADIGMLRVPKTIRLKRGALDEYERARVKSHPSFGLDMLSRIRLLPAEVPWIVYQSHERSNGTGYPHGKNGPAIHTLAKLVAISDIYVAMCMDRPHRPAHLPYQAMETLLRMAARKEFDTPLVKAFLESQSLFPVGSMVQLGDGRIAQVISSNPDVYSRPIIAPITDGNGQVLHELGERINLLDFPDISITRPLPNPARTRIREQLQFF